MYQITKCPVFNTLRVKEEFSISDDHYHEFRKRLTNDLPAIKVERKKYEDKYMIETNEYWVCNNFDLKFKEVWTANAGYFNSDNISYDEKWGKSSTAQRVLFYLIWLNIYS